MGHYDTQRAADLPVPAHGRRIRDYVIADNFFQGAFGGSFLNHQWLIAAAHADVRRTARRPTSTRSSTRTGCRRSYPLYTPTGRVKDAR